jgi:hypothetical protein
MAQGGVVSRYDSTLQSVVKRILEHGNSPCAQLVPAFNSFQLVESE